MNALPRISIVTPSYNQGQYIEQTILSVINQNYPNLEYIVIDGGSTDDTVSILKKYSDKLTYWVSEKDSGQSHAINKGLKFCTGDVFNWLNSDDFLQPGALAHIANEYKKKSFTALCCRVHVLNGTDFSHIRKPSYIGNSLEETIALFNINQEGTWWSLDAVKHVGGVKEDLYGVMDLDLWFNLLCTYPLDSFRSSSEIVSNFRRHEGAKSTQNRKNDFENDLFWFEQLLLFQQFVPKSMKLNYGDLFPNSHKRIIIIPESKLPEIIKTRITQLFLFQCTKNFYHSNNMKFASAASTYLNADLLKEKAGDIRYLKRMIFLKKWFN